MSLNRKNNYMSIFDKRSITNLRVFATILILCCHLVVTFDNKMIQLTGQFFNVGVDLFLIISGYLYGKKEISKKYTYKNWLISRAKRILTPMYIFMIFLFFIYLFKGLDIQISHWIAYIFNLQGLEIYVYGAEHLWYLTVAMACYFITPILDKYRNKFNKKNIGILFSILIATQLIMSYFIYQQFGRYLTSIELYILAYFIGLYWNSDFINYRNFIWSIILIVCALAMRLIGRIEFDGTILYDIVISRYTHSLLGLGLFFSGFYITSKLKNEFIDKIISHFDHISYEIYLVHYMLIGGPLSVLFTNSDIVNCFIVLICTYILALILNKVSNIVNNKLDLKVLG